MGECVFVRALRHRCVELTHPKWFLLCLCICTVPSSSSTSRQGSARCLAVLVVVWVRLLLSLVVSPLSLSLSRNYTILSPVPVARPTTLAPPDHAQHILYTLLPRIKHANPAAHANTRNAYHATQRRTVMAYVCECACNNHHQQQPQPIPHPCGFFSWPRRIIIAARQVERTACRARASSKAIAVTRYIHHISLAHHPHRLACWWAPRLYKPRCIETLYFSLTLSHFGEPCARILYAYRALCVCV